MPRSHLHYNVAEKAICAIRPFPKNNGLHAMQLSPADSGSSSGARNTPRRLRILVADDEPDTVLMLVEILRDEGHEVEGLHNGEDALRRAQRMRPDVLILDIEMPGLSGYAIAREVRNVQLGRTPLLIAISGKWNRSTDQLVGRAAGFDHHLMKPCDPRDLLALIKPLTQPLAGT